MAKQNVTKGSKEDVLIDITEVTKGTTHWLEVYRKPLIIGSVALLAIVAGWYAWGAYVESNNKKALAQMWKAEQMFEKDSFALALSNPGGGYKGFAEVAKEYGSTPAGNLARYYAGVCYLNLGKIDEAIQSLEDFSPKGSVTPTMKYGVLGDAYSQKKDYAKALKCYRDAAGEGEVDDLKAFYLKRFAMLSEIQNDNAAALEAYKQIKEKFALTSEARDIDKYIARAEAKAGK